MVDGIPSSQIDANVAGSVIDTEAVEVIIGTIPFLGDAFDIAWKANRRNYALMTRHIESPRKHTWRDWAFLLLLASLVLAIFAVPLIMIGWFLARTTPHS